MLKRFEDYLCIDSTLIKTDQHLADVKQCLGVMKLLYLLKSCGGSTNKLLKYTKKAY